jgi:carbamoylphosphate synthase small subunit
LPDARSVTGLLNIEVRTLSQQIRLGGRRAAAIILISSIRALMLVIDYKLEPGKALKMVDDVSSRNVASSF